MPGGWPSSWIQRAAVALWQAGQHIGSSLVNEPGTVIWNELITDNPAAVPFYEQVLGVTTATTEMGEGKYTISRSAARRSAA